MSVHVTSIPTPAQTPAEVLESARLRGADANALRNVWRHHRDPGFPNCVRDLRLFRAGCEALVPASTSAEPSCPPVEPSTPVPNIAELSTSNAADFSRPVQDVASCPDVGPASVSTAAVTIFSNDKQKLLTKRATLDSDGKLVVVPDALLSKGTFRVVPAGS